MEERNDREEIFSKRVKAGKRTYFFDVKSTRAEDYFLTITESKKRFAPDGTFVFEKHKIFLYKEDFEKFREGLDDVLNKIESLRESEDLDEKTNDSSSFTSVSFDDL